MRCQGGSEQLSDWLANDEVSESTEALLRVFFEEFWPVLSGSCAVLTEYIAMYKPTELPGKSFSAVSPDQVTNTNKPFA